MINTDLIWPNLPKEPLTINNNNNAIVLCNTEAQCWTSCTTREHYGSVEFLEQVSRRTRIAIKHIKISYVCKLINHSSPLAWGYNDNMLIAPRITPKYPTLGDKREHHPQHWGIWLLEVYWRLAQSGRSERQKDAGNGHRSGQKKYNQVQDPKQVERGVIGTRKCYINVNYVWQMFRECDCREGMAVETLNKRSSVKWWITTLDRTIQRVAEWPTDDNGAWDFHKEQKNWNRCLLGHKNYLEGNH